MLLVFPPAARSTEPPLSLARLAAFLGADARCLDLNREGIDYLLRKNVDSTDSDTWTRNALRRRDLSARVIRDLAAYAKPDRYRRAVLDLNRALKAVSADACAGVEAGLADYRDAGLSPTRRSDLLAAARDFETNIYHPLFSARIEEELRLAS
ncbi:MAG: hypothetical protein Q8M76_14895, partial [Spirochaetaceae bacterium]|nr:hypothetical protein [Spirochaetaceae bacterium]